VIYGSLITWVPGQKDLLGEKLALLGSFSIKATCIHAREAPRVARLGEKSGVYVRGEQ